MFLDWYRGDDERAKKALTLFKQNMNILDENKIPERYDDMENLIGCYESFELRDSYTSKYGYIMVSKDWVRKIAQLIGKNKCLEVMGGRGLLSKALSEEGIDIICTDNLSWENSSKPGWRDHLFPVEDLDAVSAVEKYGKEINYVIMSWPYMDNKAYRVLLKLREVNPDASIIYIGEDSGGCTANDNFFDTGNFYSHECPEIIEAAQLYASFSGIHDRIMILK